MIDLALEVKDVCMTQAQYVALGQQASQTAAEFGAIMLGLGIVIGIYAPSFGKWVNARWKRGGPVE